ncbi:mis12-mtw1 family protein [Rutstroemia sp. NJR-2017a BVV2]|nr:mis12-mtw1 family protein [Rutstroemia sp. NJR-2017a BVV2]
MTYEEEDGDFQFTRVSKRTKTSASVPEPAPPVTTTVPRRTKKTVHDRENEDPVPPVKKATPVKKTRGAPKATASSPRETKVVKSPKPRNDAEVPKRGTRKSTRLSSERLPNGNASTPNGVKDVDMVGGPEAAAREEPSRSMIPATQHSTVISLPFSDTPIINRNKELRKKGGTGQRRSSLGMRGRRASSLIDNGHSAIPHGEVETSEFYKHIEEALPEPRRMKQLLTWTGERALPEKPAHGDPDSGAKLAEALLKDFGARSEFSNWFDREEAAPNKITKVVKMPNPKNIEAAENIQALESRVKQLEEERAQWLSFKKPPAPLPPLFPDPDAPALSPSQIDTTLLDPEQAAILDLVATSSALTLRENASERLKRIQDGIEGKVDRFVDCIHKVERYGETVGRVADKMLALSAVRLEERERLEREKVGTRDVPMVEVLRSLSRILPEGSAR